MNSIIGILFNTRRTFQKLDNEFVDDLTIKTGIIFFIVGLGTGIKSVFEEWTYFVDPNPSMWETTLLLLMSGIFGLVYGRYIAFPILFMIGRALKGKADRIDVMVVTAYSLIPTLIEVPIAIYKVLLTKDAFTSWDYIVLNGLHLVSWLLPIKILIQGLRDFNEYGTLKAVINASTLIVLRVLIYLAFYLAS